MAAAAEPRIEITDHYGRALPAGFVERVVRAATDFGGRPALHASILLTDEREIATIHARFLGQSSATDVISFPLDDGVDLVVSVERAERESSVRGHSFEAELALYLVHGILHVCGFDDTSPDERQRMRNAEREVLLGLGFDLPSADA